MWTLVIWLTVGGPSIVVGGFAKIDDCRAAGQLNVQLVNPNAQFRCVKK